MGDHPRTRRILVTTLVTAVTLIILGFVLSKVRPGPVLDAISSSNLPWVVAAAIVALVFNTVQSAEVLRKCLAGFGQKITYKQSLAATAGNMAIKAALPAQTGEIARVIWLNKACNVDPVRSTAAIATLIWFKLIGLFALALTGWLLLDQRDPMMGAALLAGGILVVGLPVIVAWRGRATRRTTGIPHAIAQTLGEIRPGPLALGALHALVAVAAEVAVFAMLLHGAGATLEAAELIGSLPIVIIGAKAPLTLLGLGTRECLVLLLFAGTAPENVLLATALMFSTLEYVLPALVGGLLTHGYVRRILSP
jgi:uncharacterized membrane protein YbhN (UPF0104 family)